MENPNPNPNPDPKPNSNPNPNQVLVENPNPNPNPDPNPNPNPNPHQVRNSSNCLGSWFSRLRTFYTIPAVKFVWRVIFQSLLTALQHGQSAALAVPQLGFCAFSGRAWWLWAACTLRGRLQSTGRPATASDA